MLPMLQELAVLLGKFRRQSYNCTNKERGGKKKLHFGVRNKIYWKYQGTLLLCALLESAICRTVVIDWIFCLSMASQRQQM